MKVLFENQLKNDEKYKKKDSIEKVVNFIVESLKAK